MVASATAGGTGGVCGWWKCVLSVPVEDFASRPGSQGGARKANAREDFIDRPSKRTFIETPSQSTEVPPHASSWQALQIKENKTSFDQQYHLLHRVVPESFL